MQSLNEKKNNVLDKPFVTGAFQRKLTLNVDFTDEPIVRRVVSVVKNTFADGCK